jgi:hypothetical protein
VAEKTKILSDREARDASKQFNALHETAKKQLAEFKAQLAMHLAAAGCATELVRDAEAIELKLVTIKPNGVGTLEASVVWDIPDGIHDFLSRPATQLPPALVGLLNGGVLLPDRDTATDPRATS